MGGGRNLQISVNWGRGGAKELKWAEKIENLVVDHPHTIREVRVILFQNLHEEKKKKKNIHEISNF